MAHIDDVVGSRDRLTPSEDEPTLSRLTGRFVDRRIEADYEEDSFPRIRKRHREALLGIAAAHVFFTLADIFVVPDALATALLVRYLVLVPSALVQAALTGTRSYRSWYQHAALVLSLVGACGYFIISSQASLPGSLLYLFIISTYIVFSAPLAQVEVGGQAALAAILTAGATVFAHLQGHTPSGGTTFLLLFLLLSAILSLQLAQMLQAGARREFWLRRETERERRKAEQLLLNVLPFPIAQRLRAGQKSIADSFDAVSVLFADIAGFTAYSSAVSAEELVGELGRVFSALDDLADRHRLEKIKTIGDAYMVAAGIPEPRDDHLGAVARMALEIPGVLASLGNGTGVRFDMRVGIHTGPCVAGVIGKRKFQYDLWGDTVNIASRMESQGTPGRIQVTEAVYLALKDRFEFEARGCIDIKGKGPMTTWILLGAAGTGNGPPGSERT